jgi:hypothetical protein
MNGNEKGYLFALPRLVARLRGQEVRHAEWSRGEIYSFGVFIFGFACVLTTRALWPFVRPALFFFLPLAVWIGFLLLYYFISLLARLLRWLGVYSAVTNNPLQHFVIMSLITLLAGSLLFDPHVWLRSLGFFWFSLIGLNLLALALLKIRHEP